MGRVCHTRLRTHTITIRFNWSERRRVDAASDILIQFFSYRCCYHPSSRFLLVLSSCVVPVPCYVCLCIPLLSKFFVFSSFFLLRFHCYRFDCADFGGASSYSLIIFISSLCYQLLLSAPSDCAVLLAFSSSIWLFVYCIFFVFFPF